MSAAVDIADLVAFYGNVSNNESRYCEDMLLWYAIRTRMSIKAGAEDVRFWILLGESRDPGKGADVISRQT